jgi:hypothetical protein
MAQEPLLIVVMRTKALQNQRLGFKVEEIIFGINKIEDGKAIDTDAAGVRPTSGVSDHPVDIKSLSALATATS